MLGGRLWVMFVGMVSSFSVRLSGIVCISNSLVLVLLFVLVA